MTPSLSNKPSGKFTRARAVPGKVWPGFLAGIDRANIFLSRHYPLAASLAYYTVISVVPFFAICLAVSKGFGLEEVLTSILNDNLTGQEEVLKWLNNFALSLLQDITNGVLVASGLLVVFWSGYRVLYQLELSFGVILGFTPRTLTRRLLDYAVFLIVLPLVLIIAGTMNIFLVHQARTFQEGIEIVNLAPVFKILLFTSPIALWWVIFTWLYLYFSHNLLKKHYIIIGGLIVAAGFQLFQSLYVKIMFAMSNLGTVYASFAAVPLFMLWQYNSWLIILSGVELIRYMQDRGRKTLPALIPLPWAPARSLALAALRIIQRRYQNGSGRPLTLDELTRELNLTTTQGRRLLTRLFNAGLVAEVKNGDRLSVLPTRDLSLISLSRLITVLENNQAWAKDNFPEPAHELYDLISLSGEPQLDSININGDPLPQALKPARAD